MRPRGSFGEVATALLEVHALGPCTVREAAERAQVRYETARYTASRLIERGVLEIAEPMSRPAMLITRMANEPVKRRVPAEDLAAAWATL